MPNFLIVGAAKSGTSSLDRYLGQHPDIFIPPKKEAHFFSIPDFPPKFQGPGDEGMNEETIRSQEAYERLFEGAGSARAVGESSAFYLYYPGTAKQIFAANPHMKIVMILREPVSRAYSAYMHNIRDDRETLSFEEALKEEPHRKRLDYEPMWLYRELGLYSEQIQRYLDVFGSEQVRIVLYDDFSADAQKVVSDVCAFLGVRTDIAMDTGLRHNESGVPKSRALFNFISKPNPVKELIKPFIPPTVRERLGIKAKSMMLKKSAMSPASRAELQAFYRADVLRLQELIGRDLSSWLKTAKVNEPMSPNEEATG